MKRIHLLLALLYFISCGNTNNKSKLVYYTTDDFTQKSNVKVPYAELNGVKTIPVKINGVTLDMIYDTGCSGLHFSLAELQILVKHEAIEKSDFIGTAYSTIADGSIVENGLINIQTVEIGGEDGIVLHNVQASVSLNQEAPVLLGNGVLDQVAETSVDNMNKTINFTRK